MDRIGTGMLAAILLGLFLLPTYPVAERSCDTFVGPNETVECSTTGTVLHAPSTVLMNGFDYTSRDLGVHVLDARIEYRADPLLLLVHLIAAAGAAAVLRRR